MEQRLKYCFAQLKRSDIDALLISEHVNINYLTETSGLEGYMLITKGQEIFYFTNFLYRSAAQKIKKWKVISSTRPIFSEVAQMCEKLHIKALGFEADHLSFMAYKNLQEKINAKNIKLVETKKLIASGRAIKQPREIKNIKNAVNITLQALEYAREIYDAQMSEQAMAVEIERFMRLKGDNELAFPTIVASGKNSAFPHHTPQDKKLSNESVVIDLGAKSCGYCGDLTRVFVSSKMPTAFTKAYDTVKAAQEKAIQHIRPGMKCRDIDKAARAVIENKGYGKYFGHGLGHGVGLQVHELPYIGPASEDVLQQGMVITIEPAIYLPGRFGIRIEDMALVTGSGCELLSR